MSLKLSVIGTGYLGATHAACMASLGFEVIGFDTESSKIESLVKGKVPFYEPGLEELIVTFTLFVLELPKCKVESLQI